MKHLVLGGGYQMKAADGGEHWVRTMLQRADGHARIAFCLFARDEHEWIRVLQEQQDAIKRYAGSTKVEFQTMTPDSLAEVSDWANVIYITGGGLPARLKTMLAKHGDILKLWNGKTICGSSAGADVLCQRYMHLQSKTVEQGLGWVNANLIPHWRAPDWPDWTEKDWDAAVQKMAEVPGRTPLLCMREGSFIELELK